MVRQRREQMIIRWSQVGPRKRKLFVIREKDALEPWMKKFLVEDRSGPNVMSYVDFLCYIHREIRNILT
nr:Protein SEC-24.1 [Haemonchus contortus]